MFRLFAGAGPGLPTGLARPVVARAAVALGPVARVEAGPPAYRAGEPRRVAGRVAQLAPDAPAGFQRGADLARPLVQRGGGPLAGVQVRVDQRGHRGGELGGQGLGLLADAAERRSAGRAGVVGGRFRPLTHRGPSDPVAFREPRPSATARLLPAMPEKAETCGALRR